MLNLCFPERSVSRHGGIRVTTSIKLNEAEKKQTQAGPVPLGLTTVYSILATTFCPTQLNFFLAVASSCCFFPSKYEGIMLFKRSVSVKPRKRLPRAVEIIAFRYRLWDRSCYTDDLQETSFCTNIFNWIRQFLADCNHRDLTKQVTILEVIEADRSNFLFANLEYPPVNNRVSLWFIFWDKMNEALCLSFQSNC